MYSSITVKAPGVIKLFGEHAVVYGKLSLGAAIDRYATAIAEEGEDSGSIVIALDDISISKKVSSAALKLIYSEYSSMPLDSFITAEAQFGPALPYATIAAAIQEKLGIDISKKVSIRSSIPIQKGFASSSACSTAFAASLLYGHKVDDKVAIEIARIGDIIIHRNIGAGKIDVSTSYLGGYVSYNQASGARKEMINKSMRIVIIDTGPKKSTAETVGHVANLYKSNSSYVNDILNRINECSINGIKHLLSGDMHALGAEMLENQRLLKEIGVSSDKLDNAIATAIESGAYGAKLSGGGGGGIAIAIAKDPHQLAAKLNANGIAAYIFDIALKGAKDYMVF